MTKKQQRKEITRYRKLIKDKVNACEDLRALRGIRVYAHLAIKKATPNCNSEVANNK